MCGMARQVRKEIYMAETLNQVKKVVSEPEINKGYCYHFRVCMMWLALLQRCGRWEVASYRWVSQGNRAATKSWPQLQFWAGGL